LARKRRRARAIIGVVVVLALAAAAGTVFWLDYHQARSNAAQKKLDTAKEKAAAGVEVVGVVTAVDATSVTLRLANGKPRRLITTRLTTVVKATTGSGTDVKLKTRGLLRMKAGVPGVAQEVLVLPLTGRIGLPIAKAGFGFVWLRMKDGRLGPKVNVSGATVEVGTPAPRAEIQPGEKVVAHAQTTVTKPVRFVATDIVSLPQSSTFVA
jgi:hypothetical protein